MRRRILIAVLTLGTVGGFASGFAHLHHARAHWVAMHHGRCGGDDGDRGRERAQEGERGAPIGEPPR